jgi:lipopolysaccharide export LptBFGC system permease protein LptF
LEVFTLIIRRYLVKQVVSTSLVVVSILTLIVLGARLIKYFGVAAQDVWMSVSCSVSLVIVYLSF